MNAPTDISSIPLLNHLCDDIRGLKTATQQAFKQKLQSVDAYPDNLQEARQAGIEEGLRLALDVLTNRLLLETSKQTATLDPQAARCHTELTIAQAEYDLRAHGAVAPLASAAYSAYVQAHRRLQQAKDAYARRRPMHAFPSRDEQALHGPHVAFASKRA